MNKTQIGFDEWKAAIDEICPQIDVVPPGWITAEELAREINRSLPTARTALRALVAAGKADVHKYRLSCDKIMRPILHYKLK